MIILVRCISHCSTFNTDKMVNKLLYTNNRSDALRLPGAKNQTETGWNVGEITIKTLSEHCSAFETRIFYPMKKVNASQQLTLLLPFKTVWMIRNYLYFTFPGTFTQLPYDPFLSILV